MKPATSFRSGRSAAGCLSRILRRILCFSSLPLRSFDHFKVDKREREVVEVGEPGATPGVVARLMGLDSLPFVEPSEEESPLSSLADSFKTQVRRHRDIPDYQELHDDKFFILSFEKRRGSTRRKSSRRGDRVVGKKNKENEEAVNFENRLHLLNSTCKESEKVTAKMAKQDCLGNEDFSENSSPNSVLEFVDRDYVSPGEISRLANSKMRRPLSEELDNCGDSNGKVMLDGLESDLDLDLDPDRGKVVKSRNFEDKLDKVGKLAAMETMGSSWLHDEIWGNKHYIMVIGRDIASNVFDHILEELVIDLQQF